MAQIMPAEECTSSAKVQISDISDQISDISQVIPEECSRKPPHPAQDQLIAYTPAEIKGGSSPSTLSY